MRTDRRTTVSAAALLACWATFAQASWATATAAPRSGAPPFCVLKGGARGMSLPQICSFFDYQECLQAAADLHGNCVVNIDYHGEVAVSPAASQPRHRR
jgi:hypothetical protein